MRRPLNRVAPNMPVQNYKTYQLKSPITSHFRPATCEEVNCQNYLNGWRVRIDNLDKALVYTARNSGRKYTELSVSESENYLVFEPGQKCFAHSQHKVRIRQELYIVRGGDWRRNTGVIRQHVRGEDWVEDFQEHQDRIKKQLS